MALTQRKISLVRSIEGWLSPSKILFDSIEACTEKCYQPGGETWAQRHMMAWEFADGSKDEGRARMEAIVRDGIIAWARYGEQHRFLCGSNIGDDGVLGPAWQAWGQSLRSLLNGETGRLDCGTLDRVILAVAETCGVNLEE